MAKKARIPAPPTRRDSGGPRRLGGPGGRGRGFSGRLQALLGNSRALVAGGMALLAVVVIVVVVVAVSGGGGSGGGSGPMPVAELRAAGCTPFEPVPPAGWDHLVEAPEGYVFGTFPRTADIHHPQLVIWNRYVAPVDQMMIGHNLEHGGIFVQYSSDVSQETVAQIAEWWSADPNGIVVAPLPELPPQTIALGAWYAPVESSDLNRVYEASSGQLAYCGGFDERAFTAFKDAFRGHGPEEFPVQALRPGRADASMPGRQ